MGCPDTELVQRWQQGDLTAFEALVRHWQQPVGRFLGRFVGREDQAHDLCQEVFLRIYLAGPRYQATGAFSTWLYRIAINVARDAARRARRTPGPLPDVEVPSPQDTADVACQRQELIGLVAQAVANLPEPLRLVLVLHHYERMNFEAIGRLTDTPASTLKSRFASALKHLRARLQPLGLGPEEFEP